MALHIFCHFPAARTFCTHFLYPVFILPRIIFRQHIFFFMLRRTLREGASFAFYSSSFIRVILSISCSFVLPFFSHLSFVFCSYSHDLLLSLVSLLPVLSLSYFHRLSFSWNFFLRPLSSLAASFVFPSFPFLHFEIYFFIPLSISLFFYIYLFSSVPFFLFLVLAAYSFPYCCFNYCSSFLFSSFIPSFPFVCHIFPLRFFLFFLTAFYSSFYTSIVVCLSDPQEHRAS